MNTQKQTVKTLQKFGVKPSAQRIAIMDYMTKHYIHPTADTVYSGLVSKMPTLSKTTVYNTLSLLAQKKAIRELHIDEKNVRYDGDISQHAHFCCKKCEKIFDMPIMVEFKALEANGFVITESHQYHWGYCPDCNKALK
ncbi:MAG: transcriptional repressor [Bacteroidales bacterium]|jgi:Fe2+ or Zn2+ uptake regulation protein|nr:transcriptional repressor [Bacteroidales bacterium]